MDYLIFTANFWGRQYYFCFIGEETEALRDEVIFSNLNVRKRKLREGEYINLGHKVSKGQSWGLALSVCYISWPLSLSVSQGYFVSYVPCVIISCHLPVFLSVLWITWSQGCAYSFCYLHLSLSGTETSMGPPNPFLFPVGRSWTGFSSIPCS